MKNCTLVRLLLALFAGPALTGCFSQHATKETIADRIRDRAVEIVAAYNAQDAKAAAAYDAPDYVGISHGEPNVVGPAADEAAMKAQMAAGKVNWQLGDAKVTISRNRDMAVFEAPYTSTLTMADGRVTGESGNWIAIFRRQEDGSMDLWRSIASDTPPARPAGS
jgi:ketosteroid isomerase-like protein